MRRTDLEKWEGLTQKMERTGSKMGRSDSKHGRSAVLLCLFFFDQGFFA